MDFSQSLYLVEMRTLRVVSEPVFVIKDPDVLLSVLVLAWSEPFRLVVQLCLARFTLFLF